MKSATNMRFILFTSTLLYLIGASHGCHVGHKRRRMFESKDRLIRYFSECMTSMAGTKYRWEAIVRFSIYDTEWYPSSGNQFCSKKQDTYDCWKSQVDFLIDPSSIYGLFLKDCIKKYTDEQMRSIDYILEDDSDYLQVVRSGRAKRAISYKDFLVLLMSTWRQKMQQQTRSGLSQVHMNNNIRSPLPVLHSPSPVVVSAPAAARSPSLVPQTPPPLAMNIPPVSAPVSPQFYQQPIPKMYVPTPKVNGPTLVSNNYHVPQKTFDADANSRPDSPMHFSPKISHNNPPMPVSTAWPVSYRSTTMNPKFAHTKPNEASHNSKKDSTHQHTSWRPTHKTNTRPTTAIPKRVETADPFHVLLRYHETSTPSLPVSSTSSGVQKAMGLIDILQLINERKNLEPGKNSVMPRVVTSNFCDEEATERFTQCVGEKVSTEEMKRSSLFISAKYLSKEDMESVVKFFEENHSSCQSLVVQDTEGNIKIRKCKAASVQQSSCIPSVMLQLVKHDSRLRSILLSCAS
ncbi:uncharacterized protein LOC120342784 [Styela clava]